MSGLLRAIMRPALEDNSDGKANKELEYVFYGRVVNPEQLKEALRKEEHEQWEVKFPKIEGSNASGRIRIRRTVEREGGEPEYVLTTKTKLPEGGETEVGIPTTEDHFNQFKQLSNAGMIKDRFIFEIEGSDYKWEVDMFRKPEGGYWDWCKIDLEVNSLDGNIPPFPIDLADVITNQNGERTEEEEAKVRSLYDFEFITKNQFLQKD